MKQSSVLIAVLALLITSFIITGFQCGSPALTSAKLYIKNSDWVNAEKSLTAEVEKNPANAEAWYDLGYVRLQLTNYNGMVEAFNQSLKASNEFAKIISDAKMSVWGTSINYAVKLYNESISAPKDSASILRKKAIENYQRAILVVPDSALPYRNIAIAYRVEGDPDNEILYLTKALERKSDPETSLDLIRAYIRKAETAKASNNETEANTYFSKAIDAITAARKSDPNDQGLLGELINLYIEAGRAKEALPFIQEAVQKDPKNKVYQNNLGLLLMQTDDLEGAIQHFEAAVAADETYEDGLWNGGVAYMKLGDKMKKDAEASADPKKKDKAVNKAYVEKFKAGAKLIEKLVALKKDEVKYWEGLATAYANAGMAKEAQKAFEQADALKKK